MSLRSAILGFLSFEPTSGYTLKQRFDGSVRSFWSVTQSQVYRELHQLEADGLVRVDTVAGEGKPDKKLYGLTKSGEHALKEWLESPLEPMVLRHPLMLKFVFAAGVAPKKLDEMLASYALGMQKTRAEYIARLEDPNIHSLARSKREGKMWRLSVEHGIAWCDFELAWIAKTRKELS